MKASLFVVSLPFFVFFHVPVGCFSVSILVAFFWVVLVYFILVSLVSLVIRLLVYFYFNYFCAWLTLVFLNFFYMHCTARNTDVRKMAGKRAERHVAAMAPPIHFFFLLVLH